MFKGRKTICMLLKNIEVLIFTAFPSGEFFLEIIENSFVGFYDSKVSFSFENARFSEVSESMLSGSFPAGTAVKNLQKICKQRHLTARRYFQMLCFESLSVP